MSEKNKKIDNFLGKKKKKLNLETFLEQTSNKKKKSSNPEKINSPKSNSKSNSSDSDTEIFKINPQTIQPISKKEINKFTGKEYSNNYYTLLEKRKLAKSKY